jgi:hypothetical protein
MSIEEEIEKKKRKIFQYEESKKCLNAKFGAPEVKQIFDDFTEEYKASVKLPNGKKYSVSAKSYIDAVIQLCKEICH